MKIRNYLFANFSSENALSTLALLERIPFLYSIGEFSSINSIVERVNEAKVDMIILEFDGSPQKVLALLQLTIDLPPVIIISESHQFAVESYNIGKTVDYVVKPLTLERLMKATNRALNRSITKHSIVTNNFVFLKTGHKLQRFDFVNIIYIEAAGNNSKILSNNQLFLVNERISALADLLPMSTFLRVHKSYIININKLETFDRNNVYFDSRKIPIGISYRPKLDALLSL